MTSIYDQNLDQNQANFAPLTPLLYLERAADNKRSFPGTLPEIALKGLRVVAFVQDEADKRILGAAEVAVAEPAP